MIASSRAVSSNAVKYVLYGPSMCHFASKMAVLRTATVSTQNHIQLKETSLSKSNSNWPHDPNFPLPGNVNIDIKAVKETEKDKPPRYQTLGNAFIESGTDNMNKRFALSDFIKESHEYPSQNEEIAYDETQDHVVNKELFTAVSVMDSLRNNKVEFKIQECPTKLNKHFREFFSISQIKDLTVITISQQTENDMTSWSEDVENERNLLSDVFIESAKKICEKIHNGGYWADFVDPMSGLAYHSENQNKTLFETDDCFNQLGFHVEDLGCCKVLQHEHWKNNVFVGVIFTNAPIESHVFEML